MGRGKVKRAGICGKAVLLSSFARARHQPQQRLLMHCMMAGAAFLLTYLEHAVSETSSTSDRPPGLSMALTSWTSSTTPAGQL